MLTDLAKVHHRWGFDKMMAKIKENYAWNHKRVYRVYCELKLNLRIKPRKRFSPREAKMLVQPIVSNHCWSLDFMSDTLSNKRKFRTLNVIDDYNRECLLIEPAFSLPSMVVTRLLDQVAESKGYPEVIRSDNGPEFISSDFTKWAEQHNILLHHIQPGVEGYCNANVCQAYIDQCLIPCLSPGETVIMDNASFHKSKGVKEAIEDAGCHLLFLPPYSPDLNPIEHVWSPLKNRVRMKLDQDEINLETALSQVMKSMSETIR
ncbi:transposase [Piscirickettsia salmonis]|uniref:transposase n=1 Tax=Piscirickettsia salmonis TaxID=1238 RepID=UPI0016626E75|nr:transposase [Piscirickettsia salmonis]QNR81460.1 transposase [Piscirickettsia salmonis]